jgi:ribosomal 50S subunit-associated protein YjgA (DUF615 family)
MKVTAFVAFLLLHPNLGLTIGNDTLTVQEIDGLLYVTEPVNTFRITRHVQLWSADLQGDVDKLDVLMASKTISELSILMNSVSQLSTTSPIANFDSAQGPYPDTSSSGNLVRRIKRNILGDALNYLSGVPTAEMMAKQVKLDEDIRDKVTATLTRQMSYERSVTDVIGNITREEEVLGRHLEALAKKHTMDVSRLTRFNTHRHIVLEDMDKLEDILEAAWTGTANTRHSVYLSSRAGLQQVATFRTVAISKGRDGPILKYVARLYRKTSLVEVTRTNLVLSISTPDRLYHLHPGHNLLSPISEQEVRGTRIPCVTCAILVHLHDLLYQTTQSGLITCQHLDGRRLYNLTAGQTLQLSLTDSCSNEAIYIGKIHLRLQEFNIDSAGEKDVDALLLRKTKDPETVVEDLAAMKAAHSALNLKLHHAVSSAQEDINTFVQDTSQQLGGFTITTGISLGGLSIVAAILLSIVTCIFCRCIAARKAATTIANVMPA